MIELSKLLYWGNNTKKSALCFQKVEFDQTFKMHFLWKMAFCFRKREYRTRNAVISVDSVIWEKTRLPIHLYFN